MANGLTHDWGPIALLDDDPDALHALTDRLNTAGFRAIPTSSFSGLLSAFQSEHPSAVILDVRIPWNPSEADREPSGGLKVLEQIRAKRHDIPIIGYSSLREESLPELTTFISKSQRPEQDLSSILEEVLTRAQKAEVLYRDERDQLVSSVSADIVFVDQRIMEFLANHPEELRILDSRRFEEVIAEIWHARGYKVKLTPRTRDGGKDIYAVETSDHGDLLYVIECKRYDEHRPVGVEIVRALYGVTEAERATMGLVATTSYFTDPAHEFQRTVPHRLTLTAFNGVADWLRKHSHRSAAAPDGRQLPRTEQGGSDTSGEYTLI